MDLFIIKIPRSGVSCEHARELTEVLWESCGILNLLLHAHLSLRDASNLSLILCQGDWGGVEHMAGLTGDCYRAEHSVVG